MKKLLILALFVIGCQLPGPRDTAYYHYSCVYHCDTIGGCRTTCGRHYYSTDGFVYYYDADHGIWDGHGRYIDSDGTHRDPQERETHAK